MGVRIPIRRGNFLGKGRSLLSIRTLYRELCRNGWTDRFVVWVVDSGGPSEAQIQSYSPGCANVRNFNCIHLWRQCAHMGADIGASWRIHLNRPSAAAMPSYVKLLWPLVCMRRPIVLQQLAIIFKLCCLKQSKCTIILLRWLKIHCTKQQDISNLPCALTTENARLDSNRTSNSDLCIMSVIVISLHQQLQTSCQFF